MKKIVIIWLCITSLANAQDSIVIQGNLHNNSHFAKVIVNKFGVGSFAIAAAPITNQKFSLAAPSTIEPGVYRFQYSQTTSDYVDVIINGKEKNSSFTLDVMLLQEQRKPVFSQSLENKNWYDYQNQSQLQLQKITALQQALSGYPIPQDLIVAQIKKALNQEQNIFKKQEALFLKKNANTWAGSMVQNTPY